MANERPDGSPTGLAFVVGGLVVAVLVLGFVIFGDDLSGSRDIDVDVNVPADQATPPADQAAPGSSTAPTNQQPATPPQQ
jgi:hypothetical protein